MGHKIGKAHSPLKGSHAYIPRCRSRRAYSRIHAWPTVAEPRLLGFAAYKAGMSHVTFIDNLKDSYTKGEVISVPVTILDAPKLKIFSVRFYKKNKRRQLNCFFEVLNSKFDKDLVRKISVPKKHDEEKMKKAEEMLTQAERLNVVVYTLPRGKADKRKPEIFELAVGGKTLKEQFEFVKSLFEKEVSAKDVLRPGELVDIFAVTKGKGFQGPIKRSGSKLQPRNKSDSAKRMIASIGPDKPRKVLWTIPMPGQMGFHSRVDYNKQVLKIGENGKEVTPTDGFLGYGIVDSDYIILRGSVPGAHHRLIRMRLTVRPTKNAAAQAPEIITISGVKK